jgi:hypothetical protein
LFGFPVQIMPYFFLLLGIYALFGLQRGEPLWQLASWSLVVTGSILWHVLGHAGVARALGVPVAGIRLHGFGGDVRTGPARYSKHLAISLAGPGAGILFGLVVLGLMAVGLGQEPHVSTVAAQLLWVNLGWSVINLLPMRPLDGGNALLAALMLVIPSAASAVTHGVGLLVAVGFVGAGFAWGEPFLMLLGGIAGVSNARALGLMRGDGEAS